MTAKRSDSNQPAIVQALRDIGATVQDLHEVGKGCPDLLVGYRGTTYLIEIKTKSGKLDKAQVEWHGTWTGQVAVCRTAEEAYRTIGAME